MSKTFRAEQTREKRRRPQSKKSKRNLLTKQAREIWVEQADRQFLREY